MAKMTRLVRRHERRKAKGKSFMFDNLDFDFEIFPGYFNDGTILVTGALGLLVLTGAVVRAVDRQSRTGEWTP